MGSDVLVISKSESVFMTESFVTSIVVKKKESVTDTENNISVTIEKTKTTKISTTSIFEQKQPKRIKMNSALYFDLEEYFSDKIKNKLHTELINYFSNSNTRKTYIGLSVKEDKILAIKKLVCIIQRYAGSEKISEYNKGVCTEFIIMKLYRLKKNNL